MHARLATANIVAGKTDDLVKKLLEVAIPARQTDPGFKEAMVLVDHENGRGVLITLWNSEADLRASDEAAAYRSTLDDVREEPEIRIYEVVARI